MKCNNAVSPYASLFILCYLLLSIKAVTDYLINDVLTYYGGHDYIPLGCRGVFGQERPNARVDQTPCAIDRIHHT